MGNRGLDLVTFCVTGVGHFWELFFTSSHNHSKKVPDVIQTQLRNINSPAEQKSHKASPPLLKSKKIIWVFIPLPKTATSGVMSQFAVPNS